ncbi:DUF4142 domain-containing protein [Stenotrophomonas sp.]|uniref:DUF4142 domain-containing protein n=1 Tax=Stenotrophomonas sp. TaxID=69392 RepID=UPI0028AC626C|nr:DUF4142 domain-containing protein [Stenotrophomonas sp.]
MNIRILTTALSLACTIALAGCRGEPDHPAQSDPSASTPATASAAGTANPDAAAEKPTMPDQSAGERSALGVLNAINDHEIAAGRQALEKNVKGDVAGYAQLMIDEHTRNKGQTNALNPDNQSADAKTQAAAGQALLDQMNSKQGDAYSKAYVAAMITGHTDALAALDDKLIPATASPQAKAHLQQTREHVARHLAQAHALAKDEKQAATDKAD